MRDSNELYVDRDSLSHQRAEQAGASIGNRMIWGHSFATLFVESYPVEALDEPPSSLTTSLHPMLNSPSGIGLACLCLHSPAAIPSLSVNL